jgi:(p)ppGpp synthase/HD superfamily hydrolase
LADPRQLPSVQLVEELGMQISTRFDDALRFAAGLHREQTRKATTTPYISHLMAVAGLVMEFGGNEVQAIAALLHDAIEDQSEGFGGLDKVRAEIGRRYGTSVLSIIDTGTDADTVPKRPWEERKRAYIEHIPAMAADAALVSICDKLHNARSIVVDYLTLGDAVFERFNCPPQIFDAPADQPIVNSMGQHSGMIKRC